MSSDSEAKVQTSECTAIAMADISRILDWSGKTIRVYGSSDEPWFCGTDVASIFYADPKGALQDNVRTKYKTNLKLLHEKGGGKFTPTSISFNEGKMVLINEAGVVMLAVKSNKPIAHQFQDWIAEEVIPSIRKTGGYHVNAEIQRLTSELSAQRLLTNKAEINHDEQKKIADEARAIAEAEQKRANDAQAETERIRQEKEAADIKHKEEVAALELTSLKIREAHKEQLNQRTEHIYVFSSDKHKSNDVYKVGRTKNHPDGRVSSLNTALPINDSLYIVSTYTCANAHAAECLIHAMLAPFRESPNREFFRIKFRLLHTAITNVIAHQNEDFLYSACTIVDEVIGVPGASGKDADEYMASIAAANAASIVPIVTNEMLAREAMTTWLAETQSKKFDWVKFQVFLRSFLEARRKYSKATYRAREWKDMSAAAFTDVVNST